MKIDARALGSKVASERVLEHGRRRLKVELLNGEEDPVRGSDDKIRPVVEVEVRRVGVRDGVGRLAGGRGEDVDGGSGRGGSDFGHGEAGHIKADGEWVWMMGVE